MNTVWPQRPLCPGRGCRNRPGREREVTGGDGRIVHREMKQPIGAEIDGRNCLFEAQAFQLARNPAHIIGELAAQDGVELGRNEAVKPLGRDQIGKETIAARGIGGGNQIFQPGGLQRRVRQHHAGVPGEIRAPVEEAGRYLRLRIEQRGEAEIKGANADTGEIEALGHGTGSNTAGETDGTPASPASSPRRSGLRRGVPRVGSGRWAASP